MNCQMVAEALAGLPLGAWRYYDCLESTNDAASEWVKNGAPDLALVIADEQTRGRGRYGRSWYTPPGAALAFTIILRNQPPLFALNMAKPLHLTALGALAVSDALKQICGLEGQIKWPNDVLLNRRKVAGILVEAAWQGGQLEAVLIGIGVNVSPSSVPQANCLRYPATSVESEAGRTVNRLELLRDILEHFLDWKSHLGSPEFLTKWEERLAFRGEWVSLIRDDSDSLPVECQLVGLEADGALQLLHRDGCLFTVSEGELRPRS